MGSSDEETQEFDAVTGLFSQKKAMAKPKAPAKIAKEGTEADTANKINVFVTDNNGATLEYKIFRTSPLSSLIKNACSKLDLSELDVSFIFNGIHCKGDDTAQKLNIQDRDTIKVIKNASTSTAVVVNKSNTAEAEQCIPQEQSEKIKITVSIDDNDQRVIMFRQSKSSDLKKLFRTACEKFGIKETQVAFCYNGERINSSNTPAGLGMDENDAQIDIFQRQSGG